MSRLVDPARWVARVLLVLVPLAAAWSGLGLTERLWQAARPVADASLTFVFEGRVSQVAAHADQTWKVRTHLKIMGSGGTQTAVFFIGQVPILQGVTGFPLLWALLIATHRRWWVPLAWGSVLLAGVVLLQITAWVWLRLTMMATGQASFVVESMQAPPFQVAGAGVSGWEWALSNHAYHLATFFGPLVTPLAIWAALSGRTLRRRFGSSDRSGTDAAPAPGKGRDPRTT
ncbi:MAG: hypothetical protein RI988_615 [Pseudomonadota bacterium]|jgi:hypothetical protein